MFEHKPLILVSTDGSEQRTKGLVAGSELIVINDTNIDVASGYEVRRTLPNRKDEVFVIRDPVFYESGPSGAHYQLKVERKGMMPHGGGGNYYSANGPNARINIGATDNSTNIAGDRSVFNEIRRALKSSDIPVDEVNQILIRLDDLEQKAGSGPFNEAFKSFIESGAKWMGVLGPYLPALTKWLSA